MGVRVWGEVEERLIEVLVVPSSGEAGIRIEGLPGGRARTSADRVRAALVNCRLAEEAPAALIRLEPSLPGGATADLDLALALAALVHTGVVGAGLRWILATGRLGLDGTVHGPGVAGLTLVDVVRSMSRSKSARRAALD